jgi:hypothetical protein
MRRRKAEGGGVIDSVVSGNNRWRGWEVARRGRKGGSSKNALDERKS